MAPGADAKIVAEDSGNGRLRIPRAGSKQARLLSRLGAFHRAAARLCGNNYATR